MMAIRDAAAIIKRAVPAEQAAGTLYGIHVNRQHYAVCPFHGEKTGSLRFFKDGGWHCFGCGASGSVIDLVMQMDGCGIQQAVGKLNAAFGLGLDLSVGSIRGIARARARDMARQAVREKLISAWMELRRMTELHRDMLALLLEAAEREAPPAERDGRQTDRILTAKLDLFNAQCDLIDIDHRIAQVQRFPVPEVVTHG